MKRLNWFVFLLCFFFSAPLFALRCGHSLVDPGDYRANVYDKCGEPDSVESHYERRGNETNADITQFNFNGRNTFPNRSISIGQSAYADTEVLVEEWVYDFGRERLRKLLRFENGRLIQIIDIGKHR
jgi:Protein of unknown function (DUF2845)